MKIKQMAENSILTPLERRIKMHILSLISFGNFIVYFMLCLYTVKLSPYKTNLNKYAFWICLSLGIWNLSFSMMNGSTDKNVAWMFYKIAALGMYSFPAFTLRFFLVLTKREKLVDSLIKKIIFYIPPSSLILYSFFAKTTPVADDIELSSLGLGWTYVNRIDKISFWAAFIFLSVYIGCSLYILYRWGKESRYTNEKKQARLFLYGDSIVLMIGVITDFILPLSGSEIPPMANLFTNIFILFFYYIIRKLNLFNINQTASSELIIDTLLDPIMVLNEKNIILQTNMAAEQLLGLSSEFLCGKTVKEVFSDNTDLDEKNHGETEIKNTPNGMIYVVFSKNTVRDQMSGYLGTVLHLKDITGLKKEEQKLKIINKKYSVAAEKLERIANYDALTGIPNRRMFFKILSEKMKDAENTGNDFGLIFMDFNGFKDVNDRFGHDIGDKVLIETAKRLKSLEKTNDIAARLGGDEFVMLVNFHNREEIYLRDKNIQDLIMEPISFDDSVCQIGVATGISIYSENAHTIKDMLHAADLAMYEHKSNQKRYKEI